MSYQYLKVEKSFQSHDHISLITLDRPKVRNALSNELLKELVDLLEELDRDPQVRVVILTGNSKVFAAGADIAHLSKSTSVEQMSSPRASYWKRISEFKKPLIGAVNGFALGAGHELVLNCDIVIAGDNARFGQPETNLGIIPGAGGTQRFTRALGKAQASYYILTGELFDAQRALELGLVSKVVPYETTINAAFQTALTLASKSPLSLRLAKECILKSFEVGLNEGLEFEKRNFYLTFSSQDQKEGMEAFLEKRPPEFKGE